jgi:hypothetical protein
MKITDTVTPEIFLLLDMMPENAYIVLYRCLR